jgi:prepilin-type N-terminal cleavage/methylation domain-containing protein
MKKNTRFRIVSFTLIELLVVIVIIAILASLLLPALNRAKAHAVRLHCLSDRRNNYMALSMFASDFDDLVPHPIGDEHGSCGPANCDRPTWNGYSRYDTGCSDMVPFIARNDTKLHSANGVYFARNDCQTNLLPPIGILVAFGYVGNPELLYCPGMPRPERDPSSSPNWHLDKDPGAWTALTDDDGEIPVGESGTSNADRVILAGISNYFAYRGGTGTSAASPDRNSRLYHYADGWDSNNRISPIMLSCANVNGSASSDGLNGVWDAQQFYSWGTSHKAEGVNAAMYDGSARWVTKEEVMRDGRQSASPNRPDWMTNESFDPAGSNLQVWAKKKATLRAD